MKDLLLKFAGLFVERVPVQEQMRPGGQQQRHGSPQGNVPPAPHAAQHRQPQPPPQQAPLSGHFPTPSGTVAMPPPQPPAPPPQHPPTGQPHSQPQQPQQGLQPIAVALRAWVPQEYAGHLAPFGLHVIAAGGELAPEQAVAYGASVFVVSAECLGVNTHLLERPLLPTVFITPQPAMIPDVAGVVQVHEPLRASEVASASRSAIAGWHSARRQL